MRILVVEDSPRLQRTLITALRNSGYAVDSAADGEEGLWLANSNNYDAIVLDIMLPKRDGLNVLAGLRSAGRPTHVLLLTAKDTVADRVKGLRTGADDYLIKPFALEELLARVDALCRRAYSTKNPRLEFGDLAIDTAERTVARNGRPVPLTAREYLLLEYLARRAGQTVTRPEIEEHIYAGEVDLMSNAVDSAVCSLRKKLGGAQVIHTRRGLGYVFSVQAPQST
ncbi:MAG TPA: response regulator transcription factor [Candidatus Didemnitutus sp.]|nr:response regulator transcription factor [Candidatus Didemnitutus sp.]